MIHLGVKFKDLHGDMPVPVGKDDEKEHFPTLFIEGVDLSKLPKSGKAVIEFKKIRQTEDLKRGVSDVTIEVRSIGKIKKTDKNASEALDELAGEMEDED